MGTLRSILGGLVGGAVGAAIWVLIGYFTQHEIGWIAWGIGFVVGVGVRYGAYLGDQDESLAQGVLASVIAIASIFAAKYVLFTILIGGASADDLRELADMIRYDDEAMVAGIADELVMELVDRGETVDWPPGMTYDEATEKDDYPADIWRQAEQRWSQLGVDEQRERQRQRLMLASAFSEAASQADFSEFFSPMDLLWFALAAISAFKIAVGAYGDD